MLSKNLAYLRKNQHLTQEVLAHKLDINRTTYASYEKGTSEPSASLLIKIADFFKVDIDDLVRANLDLPIFQQPRQIARLLDSNVRVITITLDNQQRENIQYVPEATVSNYLVNHNNPEFIRQLPHFQIPRVGEGIYRAFDIQDDSMPPLNNGSIIIGRFVEREHDLKSGNRYVLLIKEKGIQFKKIIHDEGKRARQTSLRLILASDNPGFMPYTIDLNDILEAWEMIAFIGFSDAYQDRVYLLNERLQLLEQKLNQIVVPQRDTT
ncbi:hypothetical protein GCM10027275_00260 [Rhabdobacter roseus]|uniref:Transcriptional regulator with XRE-family HTH domain n=1 Tax=Rhabdobacter roseus TaxID=1655419 RepID=A0A840TQ84_9BACT|nr:LexA family transcriptional regulator [Rhabdobacter roseus]MBB5281909.1 transcriptional regulator with XRE-family HTH domain [Rhabdobacter roseus]